MDKKELLGCLFVSEVSASKLSKSALEERMGVFVWNVACRELE